MSEHVETMIHRDDDDIAASTQARAIVERARAGTGAVLPAVEVHHHRPLAAVAQRRRPHVQHKTVLAHPLGVAALRTCSTVLQRVANTVPEFRRLWRTEPIARGVGAVGNAFE